MSSKVSNEQILQKMEQGFKSIDQRFDGVDGRLDRLEMAVADHDNKLAKLVTRDEFSRFRVENMYFQHKLTKRWEEVGEANGDLHRLQRRLEIKVKKHQKVLEDHQLLAA